MKLASPILLLLTVSLAASAQSSLDGIRKNWSQPIEPYKVIGNIYYVGASGISSHIVKTSDGLILMDTGTTLMVPQILDNIQTLGFKPNDIKIILSSHAHWDHVEGHAEMQKLTGAKIIALGQDAEAISSGIDNSALGSDGWVPAKVDRVLKHGDTVTLGNTTLTAHHTPGHTKGCTTWTMPVDHDGKTYSAIFIGGTSINGGVKLNGNERHPGILQDYATTFRVLKNINAEVFLAQHPSMYKMAEKMKIQKSNPKMNPFIDPKGYKKFVQAEENKYLKQIEREKAQTN